MAAVDQIFHEIRFLNPRIQTISSIGSYVTTESIAIAEAERNEIKKLVSKESIAYKILNSLQDQYTEKQLWVIAYELLKNVDYVSKLEEIINKRNSELMKKLADQKSKLSQNKTNSQSVLDYIKQSGGKLGEYYIFLKSNKKYAKEFFSKKFTMESANLFISK